MLRISLKNVICAAMPEPFQAVELWYEDFSQTSDQEVRDLLEESVLKQKANVKKESQAA